MENSDGWMCLLYTLSRINNDRCGLSRLRKIAHMQGLRLPVAGGQIEYRNVGAFGAVQWRIGIFSNIQLQGVHLRPRILKLPSTVKADLVCSVLDREHAAQPAVLTPEGKLENRQQ